MTSPSPGEDALDTNGGLILPGGKVDPKAILRALDEADPGDDDAELRRVTFTLQNDLNKRLDKYLTDRITFMSRTQLQRLIDEGGVLVNGRIPKASTNLRRGDTVEVVVPTPAPQEIQPEDIPLDVMYEDEHIIVINKPPDIITHPARSHNRGTLVNALAWHFKHVSRSGALSSVGKEFARPGVVHRLDRNTSGVQVFAKQDEAHWKLGHQFEHRHVEKRYLALTHGHLEPVADVIEQPIGPHPSREKGYREKYVVRHDELGKPAVTIYRVREKYGRDGETERRRDEENKSQALRRGWGPESEATKPGGSSRSSVSRSLRLSVSPSLYSLVELELKTGRTHQIRVHLSHNGWPIVGDDMYGGRPFIDAGGRTILARQALHAALLGFRHPITGKEMLFTAPPRDEFAHVVRVLRESPGCEPVSVPGARIDLATAIPAAPAPEGPA